MVIGANHCNGVVSDMIIRRALFTVLGCLWGAIAFAQMPPIPIQNGGTGTASLPTGALKGAGTSAITQAGCTDLSTAGTACTQNTGTSGATVPLNNGKNTWSASQAASITSLSISTSTFTPDGSNNHYYILLVHASCPCTLANPSVSFVAGTSGVIEVQQSATGSDTIGTYGSSYMAPGGTASITLSGAANAIDVFSYFVIDSTHILLVPALNFSH